MPPYAAARARRRCAGRRLVVVARRGSCTQDCGCRGDADHREQNYAVTPGRPFSASVTVTGVTIDAGNERAELVVSVHQAVTDPADLERTESPVVDSVTLAAASVLTVADGIARGDLSVPVEIGGNAAASLDVVAAGIHPVTIELTGVGSAVSSSTFFEVLDPAAPLAPLSIAIVARASDVATRDAIVAAAGAVEEPLSVALPPAVAAEQPLPADALRSDELLALPAADLDPSAIVAIDESAIFTRLFREGEDLLSAASPLAVVSRAVWLADRPISAPAAAMLRDLGIRMLLVTDDVATGLGVDPAANVFRADLGAGASLPAMTVDGRGAALAAGAAGGGLGPDQRAARLLAELRLARSDGDGSALVLGAPDLAVPDAAVLARLAAFVGALPDTNIVSLSRLPGVVDRELANDAPAIALPCRCRRRHAGATVEHRRGARGGRSRGVDVDRLAAARRVGQTPRCVVRERRRRTPQRHNNWLRSGPRSTACSGRSLRRSRSRSRCRGARTHCACRSATPATSRCGSTCASARPSSPSTNRARKSRSPRSARSRCRFRCGRGRRGRSRPRSTSSRPTATGSRRRSCSRDV